MKKETKKPIINVQSRITKDCFQMMEFFKNPPQSQTMHWKPHSIPINQNQCIFISSVLLISKNPQKSRRIFTDYMISQNISNKEHQSRIFQHRT